MESPDAHLSHEELQRQREQIRRSFLRANTAVAIVLIAVIGLAVAAVLAALDAARDRQRAEAAEQDRREKLWHSYLTQARAGRLSGSMGRRREALDAVRAAAAIRPAHELRNEALACLALTDLEEDTYRPVTEGTLGHLLEPSLERYALSDTNGNITIHRFADGAQIVSLPGSAIGVREGYFGRAFEFSPDGRHFAARYGGAAVVWDLMDARPIFTNAFKNPVNLSLSRPVFIEGGRWLAFANAERNGQLSIFDFTTGREERLGRTFDGRRPFAFHPLQRMIAVAEDKDIAVWKWETGERVREFKHESAIRAIRWDAQGRRLACAAVNAEVTLWDTHTGDLRVLAGHGTSGWHLSFSPDGTMLLTAALDGLTRLWDTERGRLLCTTDRGYGVTFSPENERVGFEEPMKAVGSWRLRRSSIYRTILTREDNEQTFWTEDLSADGRWLARARPGELRIWDLASSKSPLAVPMEDLFSIRFHPEKPLIFLCRRRGLEMHPLETAALHESAAVRLGPGQLVTLPPRAVPRTVSVSSNGRSLLVEGVRGRVFAVDLERPGHFVFLDTTATTGRGPEHIAVSSDGRWVAMGFDRGGTEIWDSIHGKLVTRLPTGFAAVVFSPDGRRLLTGSPSEYVLWAVDDWRVVWRISREGIALAAGAAAFARDGSLLAVASSRQRVKLLKPATGNEVASLASPDPLSIVRLNLSADASVLAAATPQGVSQVWDLKNARTELSQLGLSYESTLVPEGNVPRSLKGSPFWSGALGAIGISLVVVVAVALVVVFVLGRHRRLIQDFARTETLAARRNRQLEMARVELMHSQKMKALGTLAAGTAHDFNNLLSVVRMSNKLIGREVPDNPEVAEHVSNIEQAVQQGKHVVRSMLGYSREAPDDGSPQDISEIVEETVALLSKEFLSGIQLNLELDPDTPRVQASRGRLEQILLNLFVNAAEAMQGQGKLRIAVRTVADPATNGACVLRPRPAARHAELTVADSGPGIPPEIVPRIFEPFFTTKTGGTQRGTGLGLSMVYTIAERDGFGLGLETASGKGTTFRVLIPATDLPDA